MERPTTREDYKPITVLPILQKFVLRAWMVAAQPYLQLRRPTSFGFRPGHQCAEVHTVMSHILEKRREWGMGTVIAKLDIAKVYDTIFHDAIEATFARRGMPMWLRQAYWREHEGKTLRFRTSDGGVAFDVYPRQGMPRVHPRARWSMRASWRTSSRR